MSTRNVLRRAPEIVSLIEGAETVGAPLFRCARFL